MPTAIRETWWVVSGLGFAGLRRDKRGEGEGEARCYREYVIWEITAVGGR